jgi:hypothetical protein
MRRLRLSLILIVLASVLVPLLVLLAVRIRAGPPCEIEAFGRALAISTSIWTVL